MFYDLWTNVSANYTYYYTYITILNGSAQKKIIFQKNFWEKNFLIFEKKFSVYF